MEIIGVLHKIEIYEPVVDYIDTKYPNLENVMLELVPNYEEISENIFFPFFGELANHYKSRGTHVIPGDRKYWDIGGVSVDEILKIRANNPIEAQTLLNLIGLKIRTKKAIRERNIDMNLVFQEEKPEVTVVGGGHGTYLKKHNPEEYLSFFMEKSDNKYPRYQDMIMVADKVHEI